MPRPNQSARRRTELVPVLARAFAELGYRRTTTHELAARCRVRENVLYRLWPDKRAMFVSALDHVYAASEATWKALLVEAEEDDSPAELVLDHEADHLGEHGLHRIVFAGLSETDDPEIADALRSLYRRFLRFVELQVRAHREFADEPATLSASLVAWGILGLGTVSNVGRELGLLSARRRRRLMRELGRVMLDPS